MASIILKTGLIFVVLNVVAAVLTNEDIKDDNIDRGSRSDRNGLWFGPRLGKRAMRVVDDDNRQSFLRLLDAADALRFYYDQLQFEGPDEQENKISKKIIFTPKLGRSLSKYEDKRYESVDFTPRLGRRLADELQVTPSDRDGFRQDTDQLETRAKYFSPRLGRTMNFSPRLGRALAYELYPDKIRLVRSVNSMKNSTKPT